VFRRELAPDRDWPVKSALKARWMGTGSSGYDVRRATDRGLPAAVGGIF
jgi:hypothetical protein